MQSSTFLNELNTAQRRAVTAPNQHALVLAGAGTGKTKTIVARAAYLMTTGIPAEKIRIVTFTKRAAREIIDRLESAFGPQARGVKASTFHAWCVALMHSAPRRFGVTNLKILDSDDQLQIIRYHRAKYASSEFPTANKILSWYSFARSTGQSVYEVLSKLDDSEYILEDLAEIQEILQGYEKKKQESRYLDYDDILERVAQKIEESSEVAAWVAASIECLLIDETQDTNPLQWRLIFPLQKYTPIFAVGDDAQSIYGFRGADFEAIHNWSTKIENSVIYKLEKNYRSSQEILDISNWLLEQSPLNYDKHLSAANPSGEKPKIHYFNSDYEEGNWIVRDLKKQHKAGRPWSENMLMVRSGWQGKNIESFLLRENIPYQFIGGQSLLGSAHIRDVLSLVRLAADRTDEIAAIRFLTLWPKIGEKTASKFIKVLKEATSLTSGIEALEKNKHATPLCAALRCVSDQKLSVAEMLRQATRSMQPLLEKIYEKNWSSRQHDFKLIERLAKKHTSIHAFIEEYLLDSVSNSQAALKLRTEDAKDDNQHLEEEPLTLITVHSAKGTECPNCYVLNVAPGSFPSKHAKTKDALEEERRILYVALTRAQERLQITVKEPRFYDAVDDETALETTSVSFLENLPASLTSS
jgi:DNA helicase-2/ATP-dependent DNA helicase PcrA